jgi:hypothetical protein
MKNARPSATATVCSETMSGIHVASSHIVFELDEQTIVSASLSAELDDRLRETLVCGTCTFIQHIWSAETSTARRPCISE